MARIGITMGDCAGIGPEIILKALKKGKFSLKDKFIIYGEYKIFNEVNHRFRIFPNGLRILKFIDLDILDGPCEYGAVKVEYGAAAGEYIKKAVEDALAGKIDAIVTAPIHKKAFELGGYGKKYPGHTEMLAALTKTKDYKMMLVYGNLRVIHVTTHVSLRQALDLIKKERVYKTIKIAHEICQRLKIKNIRIAVAGLNPHAGDFGLFGEEDARDIKPAIEQARKDFKCTIDGPLPADTVFCKAYGGMYDMVVAMYHDQGHIPIKILGFRYNHDALDWDIRGTNVTLGLPIIRASVDHGTAFGKAGKGTANAESMIDAIRFASLLTNK